MSATPRFTFVMTVFSPWNLFPHALACVLKQTYPHWELRIVSDGPPDPLVTAAVHSTRRLWRGHEVTIEELPLAPGCWGNRGRHHGMRRGTGDYVVWFNHDNLIDPDYLAAHVENIARHPGCVSLVTIDLWQRDRFRRRLPAALRLGHVDLLNYAVPRMLALEVEAFGPAMEQVYAADWLALSACLARAPVEQSPRVVGTHF